MRAAAAGSNQPAVRPGIPSARLRLAGGVACALVIAAFFTWHVLSQQEYVEPKQPLPADTGLARVQRTGILRVGMDASYPPFEVAAPDGTVHGFDVDLAHLIASALGVKVQFLNLPLDELRDALIASKADVIISSLQPNTGLQLAFSVPYYNAGLVLLTLKAAQPFPASLDPLVRGGKIGVELGSPADEYFRQRGLATAVATFPTIDDAVRAMTSGKLLAVVTDASTAATASAKVPSLAIQAGALPPTPYVIAAAPQNISLVSAVNSVLSSLIASGQLEQLTLRDVGP
jgi:polar amino acid transport system substrate-binding protein